MTQMEIYICVEAVVNLQDRVSKGSVPLLPLSEVLGRAELFYPLREPRTFQYFYTNSSDNITIIIYSTVSVLSA